MANRRAPAKKQKKPDTGGLRILRTLSKVNRRTRKTATTQPHLEDKAKVLESRAKAGKSGAEPGTKAVAKVRSGTWNEVIAICLWCLGVLTVLALASHNAGDASLNASGSADVSNWVGPAGAYWSDLLFQALGVGAYALGFGMLLAGWRALTGKRVRPGFREGAGTALLVISLGAFCHLLLDGTPRPYPPGGVVGAILARALFENFAVVGSYILSGALVLSALALTADGVLAGLGLRGLVAFNELWFRARALWVVHRARQQRVREMKADPQVAQSEPSDHWTLGEIDVPKTRRQVQRERLEQARVRGQELAESQVARERELAERRALRDVSEPVLVELGVLPLLEELVTQPVPIAEPEPWVPPERDADVVSIRAAEPEVHEPPLPEPLVIATEPEPSVSAPKRKRLGKKAGGVSEPEIVDVRPEVDLEALDRIAEPEVEHRSFDLPSTSLLDYEAAIREPIDPEKMRDNAQRLTKTLKDYGIDGHVREIRPGPVVTMYEFVPAPGIKLSKIAGLADDLAMSMEAMRVRIVAPIPGKGAVGIEIPNESRETVFLKEIIAHDSFRKSKSHIALSLGKDIEGNPCVADLARMPHLLVAGATGAGKSVGINAMIMSILFKSTPEEVRLIMVDPKRLELKVYEDIPHLLLPVVTDPKKAALALRWAVDEMERRYQLLSEVGVRSIDSYNKKIRKGEESGRPFVITNKDTEEEQVCESMPYIVVIVDELADLMMVASREVESSIMRLAQMARAAGIHLILATQRPSVDVLTGVIKANFPTRIAFQVASKHDSRTIIDGNGAEHLLGRGDMLYLSPGVGGLKRVHGAFVSDEEIERTVAFVKAQGKPTYDESILAPRDDMGADPVDDENIDEMYDQAVAIVSESQQASISMIQRRLRIGYNRAARLVEHMESQGIVGPADGAKPRQILVQPAPL